ncbi:heme-binding protein [Aureimonas fodinaquatilis]|uniref:Heme-binding protein n=1 Tax=Aureimonas fodinaquatilis TaxID=2565783 RepID=A0A5B0DT31_9HYPH|nr:heme-binding protein [Aureimonas fodinaquatilis]KAA0969563.1 heme-binding protein [Aureimonas fodinaquatilis]
MTSLDLSTSDQIADGVLAAGKARSAQPLTVAVLDAGGHVVVMKRGDGSGILRCEIAYGKAWGALGMGLPSRVLAQRAPSAQGFFTAIASASQGRLIPVPGGVLVRNAQGRIIGAVGVSGDTSDMDEECAVEAIAAAGLKADTGG